MPSSDIIEISFLVRDAKKKPVSGFPIRGRYKIGSKHIERTTNKAGLVNISISNGALYEIHTPTINGNFELNATIEAKPRAAGHPVIIGLNEPIDAYISTTELRIEDLDNKPVPKAKVSEMYQGRTLIKEVGDDGKLPIKTIIGEPVVVQLLKPDKSPIRGACYSYVTRSVNNGRFRLVMPLHQSPDKTDKEEPTTDQPPQSLPANKDDCETLFKKVAPVILRHEGGWVDDPADSGGATNKGITIGTFKSYAKEDLGIEPTITNLKNLTDEQATIIYRKRYWGEKGYCKVNSVKVALMIYDWSITSGGALKEVNNLLKNHYNLNPNSGPKGNKLDAGTINSVVDQSDLLERIAQIRRDYYKDLAKNHPKNKKFLKGWLNRVTDCLAVSV